MSPRTLTVDFPDRPPEDWFTDMVFVVGDSVELRGTTWTVTRIPEAVGGDKHLHMTLREADPSDTGADTYYVRPA